MPARIEKLSSGELQSMVADYRSLNFTIQEIAERYHHRLELVRGQLRYNMPDFDIVKSKWRSKCKLGSTPWNKGIPRTPEVRRKLSLRHKGRPNLKLRRFSPQEEQNIVAMYNGGIGSVIIGRRFGACHSIVLRVLKRNGVDTHNGAYRKRLVYPPFTQEHREKISKALQKANKRPEVRTHRRDAFRKQIENGKFNRPTSYELKIHGALKRYGVVFTTEFWIGKYRYDVFIPAMKTLIEVDSKFWHSTLERKCVDVVKDRLAYESGYRLIRLNEKQIKSGNIDTILSSILKNGETT